MNLSIRLHKIADFVAEGGTMADIGTDHGHLPVYLLQKKKKERAIAMDVRSGPLSRAQQAIAMCELTDKIETRLSDGLEALKPEEADTIVIAGMGGALIQKILAEGKHMWDSVSQWVLSPQSEIKETRYWLENNGFCIKKEDMVVDSGKYYVIMDVIRGSMHYEHDCEYTYGQYLLKTKNPVLKEFLEIEQRKMQNIRIRLADTTEEVRQARLKKLVAEEKILRDALKYFEE